MAEKTDIVERFRKYAETMRTMKAASCEASELDEAATIIEQLRADKEELVKLLGDARTMIVWARTRQRGTESPGVLHWLGEIDELLRKHRSPS